MVDGMVIGIVVLPSRARPADRWHLIRIAAGVLRRRGNPFVLRPRMGDHSRCRTSRQGGTAAVYVYVGTYTERPSGRAEGIYVLRFDPDSGSLTPVQTVAGVQNPSFLALDAEGRYLYAV